MSSDHSFSKVVGWVTLISGMVALLSYFLVAASVNFNYDFFSNPASIFTIQGVSIEMLRWSMITDIFGYYLMLLPLVYYFKKWLLEKTKWYDLITFLGVSFIVLGALGATILATVWPYLLETYFTASMQEKGQILILFQTFTQMVEVGIWNLLDGILGGSWWLIIGINLKPNNKAIAWLSIFIGILMFLDSIGNMLLIKLLSDTSLNIYLLLVPFWAMLIGYAILKNKITLTKICKP